MACPQLSNVLIAQKECFSGPSDMRSFSRADCYPGNPNRLRGSAKGHEDQFRAPGLSAGFGFSLQSFFGTSNNAGDGPRGVVCCRVAPRRCGDRGEQHARHRSQRVVEAGRAGMGRPRGSLNKSTRDRMIGVLPSTRPVTPLRHGHCGCRFTPCQLSRARKSAAFILWCRGRRCIRATNGPYPGGRRRTRTRGDLTAYQGCPAKARGLHGSATPMVPQHSGERLAAIRPASPQ